MEKIKIGHLSTAYHTAPILMGTGWLEERTGSSVGWKLYASGPDIVSALGNRDVDIGYIGLPPVIIGIDRGIRIRCVAGGHVEGTLLIASGKHEVQREFNMKEILSQFDVIGSPQRGSIHDIIIRDCLMEHGLEDTVRVKNYTWTDFVLEALADGEIQAAVGTPSLAVAASGFASIIIPPHRFWHFNPSYGIIVRSGVAPGLIRTFLELHEKACNLIREEPHKAAKIASGVLGVVDEDFVRHAYGISPRYCAALPEEYIRSTMRFIPVLRRLGYIIRDISASDIFDTRFIEKLHPEPAHY